MPAVYPDLRGRSVLVTGGGSGIGAAIVRAFAAQGSRVGFVDIAREESRALADALGDGVRFAHADLADIAALRTAIAALAAHGDGFDVLVNNAARDDRHTLAELTPERFEALLAVNLRHAFFAAQAVLPGMVARGHGSIVNFSSISWMAAQGGMPVYTAAKSAILGFTRSVARDYGGFGIRANTVVPGWIRTPRQEALWITPEAEAASLAAQCLKRWLLPDEVAAMVLFLASDASSGCTAQSFIVDGGRV